VAAEEAKRIHGETVPLDAVPAGEGYFGFFVRRPLGVIVAISPFNFPLNLVAHKVAPALAAGNSVVLKPATSTPITAVKLCQILAEAGLPAGALNLVVGPGGTVGEWLVSDRRAAKVTFTGSPAVGKRITEIAGSKKITLELGNTSPVVYTWNNLQPGTYRYHSGSHVQVQVQMGLYGGVVKDAAAGHLVESVEVLDALIRERHAAGDSARLVAGFCWPWSKELVNGRLSIDSASGSIPKPSERSVIDRSTSIRITL
jgi:hypothetical protein